MLGLLFVDLFGKMLEKLKAKLKAMSWARSVFRSYCRLKGGIEGAFSGGAPFPEGDNYTWIKSYLDPLRSRDSFIVEIGSRDALDAIFLTRLYSPSACFVFEPTRVGISKCFQNVDGSEVGEKITILPFALIGKDSLRRGLDLVEFREYTAGNPGASSLYEWHTDFHADIDPDKNKEHREVVERSYKVPAIAADDLPFLFQKRIFLLAIDVEGAECEVLRGAQNLLKTVDYVCVESGFNQPRRGVARDAAALLCDFMDSCNFDLISVDGCSDSLPKDDGLMRQFNLLFRNSVIN